MLRAGTASVFVRALGAPATMLPTESVTSSESPGASDGIPPATAAASLPLVDTLKQIFVQVGAFASVSNAERLVRRLRESGLFDAFVVPDVANPSGLHLVRIGPLLEGDDFGSINRELRRMGIGDSRLVSEP
jgi:cell division septation protein DedD